MSTLAGSLESASAFRPEAALDRRRVRYAIAAAGLVAGLGAFVLVATSDHLLNPVEFGLLVADLIVGTVAVSVYWLLRRPGNRMALILLALAASYVGASLQGASVPLVHSIGVLFDPIVFVLGYYAVFAFPYGRLVGRSDKLLALAPFVVALSFLPWFLFSPVVAGASPLAHCNASCPPNALMIADRPGIAAGLGRTEEVLEVIITVVLVAAIVQRLASASRPRRRMLLPVYVPALLLTVPFGIFHAASAGFLDLSAAAVSDLGWVLTTGRGTLSYGFLFAIVLASTFAGRALNEAVAGLARTRHPVHLRSLLANALDDPSLDLAFRDDEGGFVSASGEPVDPKEVGPGRIATPVEREGVTIAFVVHDTSLSADPELVHAAGQALLLVLESERLAAELGSTIAELRRSGARIAAAGDAERRKIERDLHDGAQQRLFALGVKLELAARDAAQKDPELAKKLSEVGDELTQVLDELRQLARGLYPSTLLDFGLEKALTSIAWRSSRPTKVSAAGLGRYPAEVEAAVYFCCLEGLQNIARHAGADARAEVRLWTIDAGLCFAIDDDGVGCDLESGFEGSGLANMRDRLAAFDGTLDVSSRLGLGTTVQGSIPLRAVTQAQADV